MGEEWAELPPEIVDIISKRLTTYGDYVRFRFVCRSWQSYTPEFPLHHLQPELPWLMLSCRAFFNLSTDKTHLINLPLSILRTRIVGSSHGWLVILDDSPEIRLLNPITRAMLTLPPLHTFPNVVSFFYSNIGREYVLETPFGKSNALDLRKMRNSFLRKIVLSSAPSNDGFSAIAIVGGYNQLAFCRNGFDSWSFLKVNDHESHSWEDAVYRDGLFYVVSKGGIIAVCDVVKATSNASYFESCSYLCSSSNSGVSIVRATAPVQIDGDIHYVVFAGEDLLLVSRILEQRVSEVEDESNLVCWTVGFKVFKMNWDLLMWEKIETLGGYALFIGGNSSLAFSAAEFPGCCADCIYFTDDYSESNHEDACGKHDFGIYRMWDQTIEPLPCYQPNSYSRFGWPLPIWVTPSPF